MTKSKLPAISVIIPCHNYAHLVAQCLQSIIGQTYQPHEIIVVDDSSSDDPQSIIKRFNHPRLSIIREEHRNLNLTRKSGILQSTGDLICCVDPDDSLDPFYFEQSIQFFLEDYRTAIVYSDMEYQGLMSGRTSFPSSSLEQDIFKSNFIHAGSIVKREVALLTDAYEHPSNLGNYAVDWYSWKKILKSGYWAVKQPAIYYYRRHEDSYSIVRHWKNNNSTYYEASALNMEKVGISLVVNSEGKGWEEQKRFLDTQLWDKEQIALKIIYPGTDSEFLKKLKVDIFNLGYNDISLYNIQLPPGCKQRIKEYLILQHIASQLDTTYFLYVDELIIPPDNVIESLLVHICENTISVASDLTVSSWKGVSTKKGRHNVKITNGINRTSTNAFCCLLLRSQEFKNIFSDQGLLEDQLEISPEDLFYSATGNLYASKINCNIVSSVKKVDMDSTDHIEISEQTIEGFDEEFYLSFHPDIAEAVDKGIFKSGLDHFLLHGKMEGRPFKKSNDKFDEYYYLKHNPDVKEAVKKGMYSCGYEHYEKYGKKEGRRAYFY